RTIMNLPTQTQITNTNHKSQIIDVCVGKKPNDSFGESTYLNKQLRRIMMEDLKDSQIKHLEQLVDQLQKAESGLRIYNVELIHQILEMGEEHCARLIKSARQRRFA